MRFVLANEALVVQGRCYAGFPLLIDDDGDAVQPAQSYLWSLFTRNGRISSPKSWETYGRALYDYFAYLSSAKLDWKSPAVDGLPSPVQAYRDYSIGKLGLQRSTVNQRLRTIIRFYQWAVKQGLIEELPFDYVDVKTSRTPGFLAHVDTTGGMVSTPDLMLREPRKPIKILTKEQIPVCHAAIANLTHRLMFRLMIQTGLRQMECRSFPEKYIVDPSRRKDWVPGQAIRLTLEARDMELKRGNARQIDMPYRLMEELWAYAARHRQKRENNNKQGETYPVLFLTEGGVPFTEDAVTAQFKALSRRVGFHVHPHMLRHTYATFLLWTLRKSKTFEGEPLLYVRDRLGHQDISTTMRYLHLLNDLEGKLVLAHEDELDKLFSGEAA